MERRHGYIPEEAKTPNGNVEQEPITDSEISQQQGISESDNNVGLAERKTQMSATADTGSPRLPLVPDSPTDEFVERITQGLERVRVILRSADELPFGLQNRTSDATIVNDPPIVPVISSRKER